MNTDRLRSDLTELAEEATPVDLRDGALRTSRRLGVRRAVATSAAAVVMLGAATGTALAVLSPDEPRPVPPAITPSATAEPAPTPTPSAGVTATPTSPSSAAAGTGDGLAATLYYFVSTSSGTGTESQGQLWQRAPDGDWQRAHSVVVQPHSAPVLSPDGRRVAWIDESSKPYRLKAGNLDGSSVRTLATLPYVTCGTPTWSGDGKRIIFGAFTSTAVNQAKTEAIDADGSDRRVLETADSCATSLAASADASTVAILRDHHLVVVRSNGGGKQTLTPKLPAGLVMHSAPEISPDGRHALIGTHIPTPGECGCDWKIRNFVLDLGTGSTVELPHVGAKPPVNGTGQIRSALFLPSGGLAVQLNTTPPDRQNPVDRIGVYAPDGRLLSTIDLPAGHPGGSLVGYRE